MLVPVQGGTATLGKRNRTIHDQEAAIATVGLPNVYIYNVGPREWKGVGGGKEYKIPACPKGARYSESVAIPVLVLSERDLADGGNNMDTIMDSGVPASARSETRTFAKSASSTTSSAPNQPRRISGYTRPTGNGSACFTRGT